MRAPATHSQRRKARLDALDPRRRPSKRPTATDADAVALRNSAAWQKVRASVRSVQPVCLDPYARHHGQHLPTEHVHHVEPLQEAPDLALSPRNLIGLCRNCHTEADMRARKGIDDRLLMAQIKSDWAATLGEI